MTTYATHDAWLTALQAAPAVCVERILRSADSITPFQRGEPSDAVVTALRAERAGDGIVGHLDGGLAQWIEERLREPVSKVLETGADAYLHMAMEGFALAARMPMPETGKVLRENAEALESWCEGLSGEGPADLRAEFLLALAHNQGETRRFLGLWLDLCDQGGRKPPPDFYLSIGLMGLRRMRRRDGAETPGREVLQGFARWARHLADGEKEKARFLLQWQALAGAYPRTPESWQREIREFVELYAAKPFAAWWREAVGLPAAEPGAAALRSAPTSDEAHSLVKQLLAVPGGQREGLLARFVHRHCAYADAAGTAYFLVRGFEVVGDGLLDAAPDIAARLARLALDYDRNNEPSWVLWGRALARKGLPDVAESVLWEARELFPGNAHVRTVLAGLLADLGRTGEAEALHRETMERFPSNPVCRLDLGLLLLDGNRIAEAVSIHEELTKLDNGRPAATLERHIKMAERGLKHNRRNGTAGEPQPSAGSAGIEWKEALLRRDVLSAGFTLGGALDAKNLVLLTPAGRDELKALARQRLQDALARAPRHPVVKMVARRHGLLQEAPLPDDCARSVAGRDFPFRFECARTQSGGDAFAWLWEDFGQDSDKGALVALAWLFHASWDRTRPAVAADAWRHLRAWLNNDEEGSRPAFAYLRQKLRRLIPERIRDADLVAARGVHQLLLTQFAQTVEDLLDITLLAVVVGDLPMVHVYEELFEAA